MTRSHMRRARPWRDRRLLIGPGRAATGEAVGDVLLVVGFGQGAGVRAGELVHSQVEELVEAELCLHATAAPGVFTRPVGRL